MIFDVYLRYSFIDSLNEEIDFNSFKELSNYRDIEGNEIKIDLNFGKLNCLGRGDTYRNIFSNNDIKVVVFGEVFSNNKLEKAKGIQPHKLCAIDVFKLSQEFGSNFIDYLKGNFNFIFIYEKDRKIKIISDKLNVLPLYYAFNGSEVVISSNASLISKVSWVDTSIDEMAIAMQYLFDYMLGDYYFMKGIRRIENARIFDFSESGINIKEYWDIRLLYNERLLPKKKSLDLLSTQLFENVKLYSSDKDNILVSLTGGFDGRTNLALLKDRQKNTFLTYSYGMEGSKQLEVPKDIASKTGINYRPVVLDKSFLDSYYQNTIKSTYFSNGTAPVGFCNIPYAFSQLAGYSDTILTGLFGSEILRPLHNNGIQVNDNSFAIFLSETYRENIKKALKTGKEKEIITSYISDEIGDKLADYFQDKYFNKYSDFDQVTTFFFFIIQEGIRKYFSQEISIERVYVNTRIPYFDIDMVELIYKTPWAGMYNGFLGESKFKRRRGQLLYSHIIKKYYPKLGKIVLDRGYTPNDLLILFPFNYIKIAIGVIKAKKYMSKKGGNDTFKTEEWAEETINEIVSIMRKNIYMGESLFRKNHSLIGDKQYLTYRHFCSIKLFLDNIDSHENQ